MDSAKQVTNLNKMPDTGRHSGGQELIWDYFQNEAPESFEGSSARLRFIADRIRQPARVLNIGCGTGIFERLALSRGHDVHSLDPSDKSIQQLRSRLNLGEKAKTGYIQNIPFPDAAFDVVVVSEVLEHLTPEITRLGLADIRRVLKPGGRIIGTVPSREDLRQQAVVCPCCGKKFHRWGHEQSFDGPGMRALLSEFFIVTRMVERPFVPWRTLNSKGRTIATMKMVLWRLGSHGSNENIFFEATRSDNGRGAP